MQDFNDSRPGIQPLNSLLQWLKRKKECLLADVDKLAELLKDLDVFFGLLAGKILVNEERKTFVDANGVHVIDQLALQVLVPEADLNGDATKS